MKAGHIVHPWESSDIQMSRVEKPMGLTGRAVRLPKRPIRFVSAAFGYRVKAPAIRIRTRISIDILESGIRSL